MNFHTKGLLAHFNAMQVQASAYIEPTREYIDLEGASSLVEGLEGLEPPNRNRLFGLDMVYMLDGPEQRQAQAAASFDYQALALRTCPPGSQFHGDMVSMAELRKRMKAAIDALEALDEVKKALFYRKGNPIGITVTANAALSFDAVHRMAGTDADSEQGYEEYDRTVQILHAVLGLATESGEGLEAVYKAMFLGEKFDRVNLMEEFGDAKWYIAIGLDALGYEWGEDEIANIDKLKLRFPDKFDNQLAINRDHAKERVVLEGLNKDVLEAQRDKHPERFEGRVATQFEGMTRDDLGLPLEGTVSTPRHHIGASVGKSAPDGSHDTKEPHGD